MPAAKGDLELLTAVVSGFKNSRAALNLRAYAAWRIQKLARCRKFKDSRGVLNLMTESWHYKFN